MPEFGDSEIALLSNITLKSRYDQPKWFGKLKSYTKATDLWSIIDLDAPKLELLRTLAPKEPILDTVEEGIIKKNQETFKAQLENWNNLRPDE